MTDNGQQSVKISGSGTITGGSYDEIAISGSGILQGEIAAESIRVSGSGRAAGKLRVGKLKASGSLSVEGSVEAEDFECSGSCRIDGNLLGGDIEVSGSMKIDGAAKGRVIKVSGSVRIAGDTAAEEFRCTGAFQSDGLLNAGKVRISLHGASRAREIGGESIEVLAGRHLGLFGKGGLEVEIIAGDDIRLENTRAGAVRGRKVIIGPGCRIGALEYSESAEIDPGAVVEQQTHIGR